MKKHAVLLSLIILTISSIIVFSQALASIPNPSVPEFTVKLVAYPYDVPTIYGIDPYTGQNITIQVGYHVENKSIEVTIKNQPFSSNIDNYTANLYYNVRIKGHFAENWTYQYPSFPEWASPSGSLGSDYSNALPKQSTSNYTLLSFPASYPNGAQIDFQVRAVLGFPIVSYNYEHPPYVIPTYSFHYNSSDWSSTQTLIYYESTIPELLHPPLLLSVLIAVSVTLIYFKKRKH